MKMLECRVYLLLAWLLQIEPWEYIGNHTVAFWKGRLSMLKSNAMNKEDKIQELREEYKKEKGYDVYTSLYGGSFDYVDWLENKLIKKQSIKH